jgi:hypothetical protein
MASGAIISNPCSRYCIAFLNLKGSFGKKFLSENLGSIAQKYMKGGGKGEKKMPETLVTQKVSIVLSLDLQIVWNPKREY